MGRLWIRRISWAGPDVWSHRYLVPDARSSRLDLSTDQQDAPIVTYLIFPLSVGIAILRTRLWDIDVLIRRTVVYTILTVILALLYVGIVFTLGDLLRGFFGRQQNPLGIVASTLVIAALFQPLRHGVQRVIDRRFYRRKYDAACICLAVAASIEAAHILKGSEAPRITLHAAAASSSEHFRQTGLTCWAA